VPLGAAFARKAFPKNVAPQPYRLCEQGACQRKTTANPRLDPLGLRKLIDPHSRHAAEFERERPDQSERSERPERPERPERSERPERPERPERTMPLEHIKDATDHRVADDRNVPDPDLWQRNGVFVAEGRLVVRRLLTGRRFETRSVMVTAPALEAIRDVLDERRDLPAYVVPQALMDEVIGFNIHRGCLPIGVRRPDEPWTAVAERARRLVVLERVGNADNVGSIFRHAAAFAADAVLLGPACS